MKLKEFLKNKIPANKIKHMPSSFDVIGNICILEIKDEAKKYEKLVGNSILKLNKNIKSVFKKNSARKGKYRTYKLKLIAGENSRVTQHKENGVIFNIDVEKCYFSPRLGNERLRISRMVKKNESVLVMFSGIGSFNLNIFKNSSPKEIYGVELNKTAYKYALENLKLNKFDEKKLKFFQGDVKKVLPKLNKKFDRILMPLPMESRKYLGLAIKKLKKKGILHYYTFLEEAFWEKPSGKKERREIFSKDEIKEEISKYSNKFKILNIIKCGVYAPNIDMVCADIEIS